PGKIVLLRERFSMVSRSDLVFFRTWLEPREGGDFSFDCTKLLGMVEWRNAAKQGREPMFPSWSIRVTKFRRPRLSCEERKTRPRNRKLPGCDHRSLHRGLPGATIRGTNKHRFG